jgi:hypothetical protein
LSLAGQAQAKTRQKILKTPIGAAFEAFFRQTPRQYWSSAF